MLTSGPAPAESANLTRQANPHEKCETGGIGNGTLTCLSERDAAGMKLFHGRRYLAQTRGTSRTAPRETAIGYRDGPRGENLRPRLHLLSHRELVSGPFCHSKCPEVDRSLLARAPEYGTHSLQAQRRYVQGVTAAF